MTGSEDAGERLGRERHLLVGAESPGTVGPGNRLAEKHGLRRRRTTFERMCAEVPEVQVEYDAIVEAVPIREPDGGLAAGDVLQAQALAMQAYTVKQAAAYFAKHPDEPQALALWSQLIERHSRALERLGIGASARVRLGLDLAQGQSLTQRIAAAAERKNNETEGGS